MFVLYTDVQCWKDTEIDAPFLYEVRLWHYFFLWEVTVETRVPGCVYSAPSFNCWREVACTSDGLKHYNHCANWNCISVRFFTGWWLTKLSKAGRDCTSSDQGVGGISVKRSVVQRSGLISCLEAVFCRRFWHLHIGRDSYFCWTCDVLKLKRLQTQGSCWLQGQ